MPRLKLHHLLLLALLLLAAPAVAQEPPPEATAEMTAEPEEVYIVEPLTGQQIPPPLELELPEDWQTGYDQLVFVDVGELRVMPFALYTGPVSGGQGFIVLLWGFPNITTGNPFAQEYLLPNLYTDGLRLLRLAVVELECNVGTDLQYEYEVGGLPASGTQFAAVDCPQTLNTRGWFAGLQVEGLNFVFYMFTEPIAAMNGRAPQELQDILDTVTFHVAEWLEEQAALAETTPEATAEATAAP